jgi:C4-dicarboxylate-specific signal transduction histidine kinase
MKKSDHLAAIIAEMDRRYQERYEAQQNSTQAALMAAEKAVNKAEESAERRFESVNEFRGQLSDQAKTFVSRQEYTVQHSSLSDRIDAVYKNLSERIEQDSKLISVREGRYAGMNDGWKLLVGLVGLLASAAIAISVFHR